MSNAWAALEAMPTTHALPMSLSHGMKSCGGCHRLGLKSEEDVAALKAEGSVFGQDTALFEEIAHAFPDLLTSHDAPTVIEQRLFEMLRRANRRN